MARLTFPAIIVVALALLAGCATSTPARPAAAGDLVEMERMAEQAYARGDFARASDLYAGVVEAMPDQAEYWYRLGNAYARQGLHQEAALSYRQSLALDASNARGWHNLGMMHLRLANESFLAGEKRGSQRARAHEENQRLADATSRILDEGAPMPSPAAVPARSPVGEDVHQQAGGEQ